MPYIPFEDRELAKAQPTNVGELTYVLYAACLAYFEETGGRYANHAEVIAALECTKLEWYRRQTAEYEQAKLEENGDV